MGFVIKPHKDPANSAKKYAKNTAAAGDEWLEGFKNPKRDPRAAAAASAGKWEARLNEAIKAKRFGTNVAKYNADEAIANAEAVGKDNYTRGTVQRLPKVTRKMVALAKVQVAIDAHLVTMPNVTAADREARALYQMREMAKAKGTIN